MASIVSSGEGSMKHKHYHGWIYIEKSNGLKDFFSVHVTRQNELPVVIPMGYGANGAASAVEFFEANVTLSSSGTCVGLNLGPVKLEQTPLGLRVFTIE
jgi:hypothetical protein